MGNVKGQIHHYTHPCLLEKLTIVVLFEFYYTFHGVIKINLKTCNLKNNYFKDEIVEIQKKKYVFFCQIRQRLEKVRALLSNGSRQNGSRELVLPRNMDIVKIVSDDATGDEESVEELPEVSDIAN